MRYLFPSLTLAAATLFAIGCGDQAGEFPTESQFRRATLSGEARDAGELIDQLFPPPGLKNAALSQLGNIDRQRTRDLADARAKMFELVDFTLQKFGNGQLNELSEPSTEEVMSQLIDALFTLVELDPPGVSAGALGDDGVVAVVDSGEDTEVVTPSGFAGVLIEAGDLNETVLVTIQRVVDPDPCLPIGLAQFEGCYEYTRSPAGDFAADVTVAICLDPAGLSPEQIDLLQLHRFDGEVTEALPNVSVGFLDCTDFDVVASAFSANPLVRFVNAVFRRFSPPPLLAAPMIMADKGLGGLTGSFSTIGWALPGPTGGPTIAAPGFQPSGLAYDGTSLYVSELSGFRRIFTLNPTTGAEVTSFLAPSSTGLDGNGNPSDLAYDGVGQLFVSDIGDFESGMVYEIDVAGTTIVNSFSLPFRGGAIAFDGTNLYIGDFDSPQILVTTRSGTEVRTFSSGLRPAGMVFNASGNLWVISQFDNKISEITTLGVLIRQCDGPREPGVQGLGGVTLVGSELYIAEVSDPDPFNDPEIPGTIFIVDPETLTCEVNAPVLQPSELCSDNPDAAIATFEDANLEAAVRFALGVGAEEDLTCGLISGLTSLFASSSGITSLVGIQNLTSLMFLVLSQNSITDIGPLSTLTSLTNLLLSINSITNIDMLSGLISLTQLSLDGNGLSDIGPLSGLTSLTNLGLSNNTISDISALGTLTNLTQLRLNLNSITAIDIGAMSGLTSLTNLNLSENPISVIDGLAALTSLTVLSVSGPNLSDIGALSGLTTLTQLFIFNSSITDISALRELTSLTFLFLRNNTILSNIQPLLENTGLGLGDEVDLTLTAVSCPDIALLEAKGVTVVSDCPVTPPLEPVAHLTLRSEPGDLIGQGGMFDIIYTPENSQRFSAQIRRTIGSDPAELLFVLGTVTGGADNTFALLFFGTDQLGIPIQPGVYPDAERADIASPGHPGLDINFQNRGCSTLTGKFTIDEVTFFSGESGELEIETFSASFEQHCHGAEPALFGTFTYDAHGTVP